MNKKLWLYGLLFSLLFFSCTSSSDEKLFNKAIDLWNREKYDESVQNFITLTKSYPYSPLVEDSLFWIAGIYHYYLNEPERAIRYYRVFSKNLEDSIYYKESMWNLAKIYKTLNDENKKRAILIYRKLQAKNAATKDWERYQYQIIRTYVQMGQYDSARIEIKKFIEKTPTSVFAPKVFSIIGFTYYIEKQYTLAEKAYKEMKKRYPDQIDSQINLLDIYQETRNLRKALQTLKSLESDLVQREHLTPLIENEIKTLQFRISKLK